MSKSLWENKILHPRKVNGIYVEVLKRSLSCYIDDDSENLVRMNFLSVPRIILEDYSDALGRLKFNYSLSKLGYSKPCLYRISNDINKFYIFGTLHCLSLDMLSPRILDLMMKSSMLVVERDDESEQDSLPQIEVNYEASNQPKESEKYLPPAICADDTVDEPADWFENYLSSSVQRHISWAFNNADITGQYFLDITRQGPYHLGLVYKYELGTLYDAVRCMDHKLVNGFRVQNKSIIGLETFDEAFKYYEYEEEYPNKTEEEVAAELNSSIEDIIAKGGDQMIYAEYAAQYVSGRVEHDDNLDITAKRNKHWFEKLLSILANNHDGLLVAIGASHLPGKEGILEHFQNAGYEVVQLDNNLLGNDILSNNSH